MWMDETATVESLQSLAGCFPEVRGSCIDLRQWHGASPGEVGLGVRKRSFTRGERVPPGQRAQPQDAEDQGEFDNTLRHRV